MALRSEIIVRCEDFLTSRVAQQISQSFHQVPPYVQPEPMSSCKSNGRGPVVASRRPPVDHVSSDDLPDTPQPPLTLNFTSLSPDDISHCWTNNELSPTDSAIYSDDFSPLYDPLSSPHSLNAEQLSPVCSDYSSVLEPGLQSNRNLAGSGKSSCSNESDHSWERQSELREVPRWKSNWSLEDLEPNERRKRKTSSVPFYIPIPKNPMKPRIGIREIDAVSELSSFPSPDGSSGISSSSPASDTECYLDKVTFLSKLHDCRVGVGQVARFRCHVLRGRAVSVTWHHGERVVENGGRYRVYRSGDTTHSLEIYFVTFADVSVITCRAITEECLGETSALLRVRETLLPPRVPEFVHKLESVEAMTGEDVELSCKIRGHPVPSLTWYFNGRKVTPMDSGFEIEHIGKEEWLVLIDKRRLLSSATVRCVAHNPIGEVSCAASIILLSAETNNGSDCPRRFVEKKLVHLDKKLNKANSRVLDSAEELLSNATQMMSLDRQLKVVDSYLDRIEAKFKPSGAELQPKESSKKTRRKPPPKEIEPELSLIQVSFPPTLLLPLPPSRSPSKTPSPGPTAIIHRTINPDYGHEALASASPPPPPSVSITVLSKHVASDKVRVVFKKSFDDLHTSTVPTRPVSGADFITGKLPLQYLDIPVGEPLRYLEIPTKPKPRWEEGVTLPLVVLREGRMDDESNPYSAENLQLRAAAGNSVLRNTIDTARLPPPYKDFDPVLVEFDQGREVFDTRNQYSKDYVVKPKRKGSPSSKSYLIQPEVFAQAETKVNRASDRLQRLDNRIGILQAELDVERHSDIEITHKPEELRRLQSAVDYTAAEVQETERTIKQVESLVTRLHIQQQQPALHDAERGWTTVSPDFHDYYSYTGLGGSSASPIVAYGTMTSTPQDFPQDGPSVRSLMNRFQNEKNGFKNGHGENGGHRLGSAVPEDSSDFSTTSTPDKDRKPQPVFNRVKFQESLAAAKSQAKPRIQASITARSLSREMREQLHIQKPQIGAFRSNIMTAENGEYDPNKAAKAKELAMADSAALQPSLPSTHSDLQQHANHTTDSTTTTTTSKAPSPIQTQTQLRQAMLVFDEEHEDQHEDHQLEQDLLNSVADSVHSTHNRESSGTYDMDSLDEDGEHENAEPHYAQVTKKQFESREVENHEDKGEEIGKKVNGHQRTNSDNLMHSDNENDSGASEGHREHHEHGHGHGNVQHYDHAHPAHHHEQMTQQHNADEEEGDLPLSQAPNWDLLI